MDRADILYAVQARLIDDLSRVVERVKKEYAVKLTNNWVFEHLDDLIKKLQPARVESVDYTRSDLEEQLKTLADKELSEYKEKIPKLGRAVGDLIHMAGGFYDLIHSRAEKELLSLESKSSQYNSAEELVEAEFQKVKAFDTREEHKAWVIDFSTRLEAMFDILEELSLSIVSKKGAKTWARLKSRTIKSKLGSKLDFPRLPYDISTAKYAILESYQRYETRLMIDRYSS